MNIQSLLRSFTFIACGAAVLALLAGLFIGSITTPQTRPVPFAQGEGEAAPSPTYPLRLEIRRGTPPAQPEVVMQPKRPDTPPPDEPPRKVTTPVTFHVEPVRPADLKEGHTDAITTLDRPVEIKGSILVRVRNHRDHPVSHAVLRLEVNGGPLGWLAVRNATAERTENPGEWRYNHIMAGRYRVSSITTGYGIVSREIELTANTMSGTVDLRLEQPRPVTVRFRIRMPDGNVPDYVQLRAIERAGNPNRVEGRFGEHQLGSAGVQGFGTHTTRYKMPDTGVLPWNINSGSEVDFEFRNEGAGRTFFGGLKVSGVTSEQQFDVQLKEVDPNSDQFGLPASGTVVSVSLTFNRGDGQPVTLKRVNLRIKPESDYFVASRIEGNRAEWDSIQTGRWMLAADIEGLDADFVTTISFSQAHTQTIHVDVGKLTVRAGRDPGSPARGDGGAAFRLRFRPMGSGELERTHGRELAANQQGDSAVYLLAAGRYVVLAQPTDKAMGVEPPERGVTVAGGSDATLDFVVRAASTLTFVCVDNQGVAIAGVEYLLSFNPAGELKEEEKARVELSGPDGRCTVSGAPYGAVYLHIWTASTDWTRPDKVFRVDLPAHGQKDLGAVVLNR